MRTNKGFDLLAPVYDALARLIFGRSIRTSQTHFLDKAPANAKVLILGGGTGWLLEELLKQNALCEVWYIEVSSKMIEKTRARALNGRVHFIQGTEEDIPPHITFDVIITNFYLDLFSEDTLRGVIQRLTKQSTSATRWIITDFVDTDAWWQRWMLKIMYLFFRSICKIEAMRLPDWSEQLNPQWKEINSRYWYGSFIKSCVVSRKSF